SGMASGGDTSPPPVGSSVPADYEMDPEVKAMLDSGELVDALMTLPTMSLTIDMDDMFDPSTGIYSNPMSRGLGWERLASIEYILPDGSDGFQENTGIRVFGNWARQPDKTPKRNFRLLFKDEYGDTKLRFPLFGDDAVDTYDQIALRSNFGHGWVDPSGTGRPQAQYIRDHWAREVQKAMGHPSPQGQLQVHLYINGLYWGLYQPMERPDAGFAASYLGGDKEDYDVIHDGNPSGDTTSMTAWNTMMGMTTLSSNAQYEAIQTYLNIESFIDYMVLEIYGGNTDWPGKNWWAARNRTAAAQFHFFAWDSEEIFRSLSTNNAGVSSGAPGTLYSRLRGNAEFRLLFADRVQKYFFNSGLLTPEAMDAQWRGFTDEIYEAMVAESVRWGDYRRDVHQYYYADWHEGTYFLYTRDNQWLQERDRLLTGTTRLPGGMFPQRTGVVLQQFKDLGLYPTLDAASFNQHGGRVSPGFNLTITAPAGTIYYTLDGTDPREYGTGAVSGSAILYSGPVALSGTVTVKARVLSGPTWSALNEALFDVGMPTLAITEINYNPYDPAAGPYDNDDFEFIELKNIGASTQDMEGISITDGVTYTFGDVDLAPGAYILVVSNETAFLSRYTGFAGTIAGEYTGNLGNNGEEIELTDALANEILEVEYEDGNDWPGKADGIGSSLEAVNVTVDDIVVDNLDAEFSTTGVWQASGSIDPYNGGSLISVDVGATATWTPVMPVSGGYDVYAWWGVEKFGGGYYDRDSLADYTVAYDGGSETVKVDQNLNSGQWNLLGTYEFVAGTSGSVTVTHDGEDPLFTAADAVRFVYNLSFPQQWRSSTEYGGTPGAAGMGPYTDIVINEVLTHTDLPLVDSIELYNTTASPIDISGWCLSDSSDNYKKFQIPAATSIAAFSYLVFDEANFGGSFLLDGAHGEDAWLLAADGSGDLTFFAAHADFGAAFSDVSFGLYPNGDPAGDLVPMSSVTLASANSYPVMGPVVFKEIMYHPEDAIIPPLGEEADFEYIELYNMSSSTVALSENFAVVGDAGWKLTEAVDFEFAAGDTIPSGASLIVVGFDPMAQPAKLAAFLAAYPEHAGADIVGGWTGQLSNSGEEVRLRRPDAPPSEDPIYVPYVLVEKVAFDDTVPWPEDADGRGDALVRLVVYDYANDAANWGTVPVIGGDTDLNYKVDGTDLATLGLNWKPGGTTKRWAQADFDGDGDVDGVDSVAIGLAWRPGGYGSEGLGAGPLLASTGPTSEASDEPLATTEVAADESQPVAPLDLDVVVIAPRMALRTRATMPAVGPIDLFADLGTESVGGVGAGITLSDIDTFEKTDAEDGLVDILGAAILDDDLGSL
ncbi:MAG: lamin tail domain-containing protein, partial [Phycisphaerae bacterium]|nr:lamin tail domain-containing protein [Phycisphaerae bacterium]